MLLEDGFHDAVKVVDEWVDGGRQLSLEEIEFNRHRTGHRGVDAIARLPLEDGVYLVAASNTLAVGHAFVLQVRGAQRTVLDDSSQRPLDNYGEWIDRVMFVRKVALLD
ncbi:hypothetical protein P3T76_001283 [Phytophthora citrophthora]|uniref:Uncharacterized protein n=1 Tax=Phytophthora citrophthora TaxID=4793 RepID=A0AAD9LRU7_9STRA|nr:hypothetical protein P3T76_001283 [Phytophthora citrophthora]